MFRKSPAALQGANEEDSFVITDDQCKETLLRSLKYYDLNRKLNEQEENHWFVVNRNIASRLQTGPSCGLVALQMTMEVLNIPKKTTKESLLDAAKRNGYSNLGEMFFAQQLANLGEELYPGSICKLEPFPSSYKLTESILNEEIVLVPYDAAGNHSPGLFGGSKAHWAVIKGISCLLKQNEIERIQATSALHSTDNWKVFFHDLPSLVNSDLRNIITTKEEDNSFVIAQQGKSKHQAVWSYLELKKSNENLKVPTQSGRHPDLLLPNDLSGLCDKVIVIKKRSSE